MNAHANPSSYAASLQLHYSEVRKRITPTLDKPAKPVPAVVEARRPTLVQARSYVHHDSHVALWRSWQAITGVPMTANAYLSAMCYLGGITMKTFRHVDKIRALVRIRHSIIRSLAHRYPHLSAPQIGSMVNREHTSVLNILGRTKRSKKSPVGDGSHYHRKVTSVMLAEIRRRYDAGNEYSKDIARDMGISATTVCRIGLRKTWVNG